MCRVCGEKGVLCRVAILIVMHVCLKTRVCGEKGARVPVLNVRARVFATEDTEHHEHHDQEERRHSHAHTVHRKVADELVAVQEPVH